MPKLRLLLDKKHMEINNLQISLADAKKTGISMVIFLTFFVTCHHKH
jgi:hypothetical protein